MNLQSVSLVKLSPLILVLDFPLDESLRGSHLHFLHSAAVEYAAVITKPDIRDMPTFPTANSTISGY